MTDAERLTILKADLQKTTTADDAFLTFLLNSAKAEMEREGIAYDADDIGCEKARIDYAAYLFRKRGSAESAMPRFLRYELNNLLLSQKAGDGNDI